MSDMRTLGEHIRGARLGWRWCDDIGAYVRLSDDGEQHLIDCRIPGEVPRRAVGNEHRCWWEGDQWLGQFLARLLGGETRNPRLRRSTTFTLPTSYPVEVIG